MAEGGNTRISLILVDGGKSCIDAVAIGHPIAIAVQSSGSAYDGQDARLDIGYRLGDDGIGGVSEPCRAPP